MKKNRKPLLVNILATIDSEDETEVEPTPSTSAGGVEKVILIDKKPRVTQIACSLVENEVSNRVFTSGIAQMSPLASISNFEHRTLLSEGLKNCGVEEFDSLQKKVIPHLYRGDDLFIIGGSQKNVRIRTLSYLIPVIGRLVTSGVDEEMKFQRNKIPASSPLLLIICADVKSAIDIQGLLFSLLSPLNQRHLVYDVIGEFHDLRKLEQGLNIMVSTVNLFFEMLLKNPGFIGFEKLQYLVYEDVNLLARVHDLEFTTIRTSIDGISRSSGHFYQRIFTGKKWCSDVELLYKSLSPLLSGNEKHWAPMLFINSYNQLIKYSEVQWYLHHVSGDVEKMQKLVELLKSVEMYEHRHILIVCSTATLARWVRDGIMKNQIYATLAETDDMRMDALSHVKTNWLNYTSADRKIMVINDEALMNIHIRNITSLVHFDLGISNKRGAERFSCMWNNIRDITKEKINPLFMHSRKRLVSHFLLTGMESELHKLRKFGAELICGIPESLTIIADQMEHEVMKRRPFCLKLKLFGNCLEIDCKDRHEFLLEEMEADPILPRCGEFGVRIAKCINPSLYTGQVFSLTEFKGGKRIANTSSPFSVSNYKEISVFLNDYLLSERNRKPPPTYDPGTLCILQRTLIDMQKTVVIGFRARILQIETRTAQNYPKQLRVFCIDSGYIYHVLADQVYAMPSELINKPPLAVEIVLANLRPIDSRTSYSGQVNSRAEEMTAGRILTGKIMFSAGETVWVNPLVDFQFETVLTRSSIRQELMKNNCAENNSNHLAQIIKLARNTGFRCPELEDIENSPMKDIQFMSQFFHHDDTYRWAFIDTSTQDDPKSTSIWVTLVKNPYCVYGNLKKFETQLDTVNDELNKFVEALIAQRCSQYVVQFMNLYQKDLVVAVKDRVTKKWIRGLITNVHVVEFKKSPLYDVLLVDIGDVQLNCNLLDLFPISRHLVDKLPFQAIAFTLLHVAPVDEAYAWDKAPIDELQNLTLNKEDDGVDLDVVALKKLKHDEYSTILCNYYQALLFLASGQDIGKTLVDKGCAVFAGDGEDVVAQVGNQLLIQVNESWEKRLLDLELNEAENHSDEDDEKLDAVGYDDYDVEQFFGSLGLELPPLTKRDALPLPMIATTDMSVKGTDTSETQPTGGFSELLHPLVLWRQTDDFIILQIDLPDVEDFSLNVEDDSDYQTAVFRTIDPPNYGFDLNLYGAVVSSPPPAVQLYGQYVKIKFKKMSNWTWPSLCTESTKHHWLKEDCLMEDEGEQADEGNAFSTTVLTSISRQSAELEDNQHAIDSEDEIGDDFID